MVYGAILEKGEKSYTHLRKPFELLDNFQKEYNWLITDCCCYPKTAGIEEKLRGGEYCFISGDELTEIVFKEDFQWIWAVLSGFKKDIPLERILEYPLPYADCNRSLWNYPLALQHPLAEAEIVPWDSGLVLFSSVDKDIVDKFRKAYPLSEDLAEYNKRFLK